MNLAMLKLVGYGVGALAIIALFAMVNGWRTKMIERGEKLAVICQATRDAAGRPKLKCSEVPAQIKFLGESLSAVASKTAQARASDAANKVRVEGQQSAINQERGSSYETRIADARAHASRVHGGTGSQAHSGGRGSPSVPGISAPAGKPPSAAAEAGLSDADKLTATEQAIQLDELIKWTKAQHAIDPNVGSPAPAHP